MAKFDYKTWRKIFGGAAKYCAEHREPGEKIQECIKRVLREVKEAGKPPAYLIPYMEKVKVD